MGPKILATVFLIFIKTTFSANIEDVIQTDKSSLFKSFRINRNFDEKDKCELDLRNVLSASLDGEEWALKMLDASAKLPSGLLMGNIVDLGHYDECMTVSGKSSSGHEIKGQHCMVYVSLSGSTPGTKNVTTIFNRIKNLRSEIAQTRSQENSDLLSMFSLGFGVCVPNTCSNEQIKSMIEDRLSSAGLDIKQMQLNLMCYTNEPRPFTSADWIAIVIFSIFGAFLICSTLYDLYLRNIGKTAFHPILLAFSMYTNGERLLAINPPNKSDSISCIHGLRALSISWVVFAHHYSFVFEEPLANLLHVKDWVSQYHSTVITGASVAVDTFFVLSGILLSYIFLKHMSDGKRKFNIFSFYIHRYLRLTPPYAAMILLQASLLIHMGNGPLWNKSIPYFTKFCTDYFWSALLYIQTIYNTTEICVVQSWYLSADMQMFLLSPLLLIPMLKWPKYFVALSITLLLGSIGIAFGITYVNNYSGAISDMETFGAGDQIKYLYMPTYTRFGPWLAGILSGYVLHNMKKRKFKLNPRVSFIMWLVALTTLGAIVIGAYPFYQLEREQNVLEASFYQGFSRLCWGIGICWIIIACSLGSGGPINWFLSWGFWQPLSRLSYCIYLTHYQVQLILIHSVKTQGYFSDINMIHGFIGDMGLSICVSILWSLAFESPVTVIEKLVQAQNKPERSKSEPQNEAANRELGVENGGFENNPVDNEHIVKN